MNNKDIEIALRKEIKNLSGAKAVRAWQRTLRRQLPALIGDWPERKTAVPPAQVTGRIVRPDCVIEKVIVGATRQLSGADGIRPARSLTHLNYILNPAGLLSACW